MNEGICLQGMWLSEEVLLSKSTMTKKLLGKLKRQGVLQFERAAHVSNSNNRDNPLFSLAFYYVKEGDDSSDFCFPAAAEIKVPLSEFIDMCNSLEKFVLRDDELSREIFDRLQKYTGVTIPRTPLTRCTRQFTTFIEKLRKENFIMFSIDVVNQAAEEKEKEGQKAIKSKEEKEQAEKEQAEEELRETEQAEKHRREKEQEKQQAEEETKKEHAEERKMCAGVVHQLLDRALPLNPFYVLKHWNFIDGSFVSKSCYGISVRTTPVRACSPVPNAGYRIPTSNATDIQNCSKSSSVSPSPSPFPPQSLSPSPP